MSTFALRTILRANLRTLAGALAVAALVAAAPLATTKLAPETALAAIPALPLGTPLATATETRANTAPTITITPLSSEFMIGEQVVVTVEYCDSQGLNLGTRTLTYNNVSQSWPVTYTIGNPGPCLARAVATGTVTVMTGSNTVRASIEDDDAVPLWSGWKLATYTTPVPWSGVSVTPEAQFVDAPPSTTGVTQRFVVTNVGDATTAYTFGSSGSGSVTSVSAPAPATASLSPGASITVTTTATSPSAALAWGRVTLTATGAGQSASAWTEITSVSSPRLTNGVVLLNPTGIQEKSLCVSIAVGPGAAAECGDLRLAYGLPGVMTKGKGRAPTLIYSAQAAHPTTVIPADLSLTSVVIGTNVTATVVIIAGPFSGTSFPAGTWLANDWAPGGRRRILAKFDGASLPTGRYPYRLDMQINGGTIYSAAGVLLTVNRADSYFNAGWWLAGLELLVPYTTSASVSDTLLWVGGDGSARVFTETAWNSCVFLHEALDRPDSIVGTPSPGGCVSRSRRSSNGTKVVFDDLSHQHRQTINRLGETTNFAYRSSDGKLDSITVPSGSVVRTYRFLDTGGVLDTIHAPRVIDPTPRFVTLQTVTGGVMAGSARSRTVAFRSSALDTVALGYEGGNGASQGDYRIVTRRDRMNVTTTFAYDAAYRVASASVPASVSQTITQTLRAVEGQGVGTGVSGQAFPLDSVYTRLDGPRSDVADVNKWWVNRYGAPTRVRNAVGLETRMTYDALWPALPATVTDAAGVTTMASYHATRALVLQTTVKAPFGGADAVTNVVWDGKWDMPTNTTDPNGVTSTRTYDFATGNLLSERVGADVSRTTTYVYDPTTKQLTDVFTPGIGAADRLFYDTELGNVSSSSTPRGVMQWLFKDRIGRDTLTRSSVDTIIGTTTKLREQRLSYDVAGRVWQSVATAPPMSYALYGPAQGAFDPTPVLAESLFVRTTYDKENRALTINSFSRPAIGNWDVCGDPVGKCAGVPPGTEGSYDIRSYDWVGRPLTQRLGSGPMMVTYDPAGNVVSEVSRNGYTIPATFDAANRLVKRVVPSVTHSPETCTEYGFGMMYTITPFSSCWMQFPLYPSAGSTGLVIAADTTRFVFDAAGRMVRADNKDARISRSYYPAGALKTDSLRTRSYATASFTATVFGTNYTYDIGGRRSSHVLPTNLGDGTITYGYDADQGFLKDVYHGTSHAQFHYDIAGRQDSLRIFKNLGGSETLGVIERRSYDMDGQLTHLDRVRKEGAAFTGLLVNDMTYDARGKVRTAQTWSAVAEISSQTSKVTYSGLGAVVSSEKWVPNSVRWEAEQFRTTAMGEVFRSRSDVGSQTSHFPVVSAFDINGALQRKTPVLPVPDSMYTDTTYVKYDLAGNAIRSGAIYQNQAPGADRYYSATRNYYAADNRLVAVQKVHATDAGRSGAWEEFRYDALGRRVLSRSRRGDNGIPVLDLCNIGSCDGYVERTVWDGDQVLYELRVDGGDSRTAIQLDQLTSSGVLWGKAGYVHAGGIDKPIVTMDGRVPSYDWRGLAESSTWTDGAKADCTLVFSGCVTIAWSSGNTVYNKPSPWGTSGGGTPQWAGTVLVDGAGSTGMLYRRNRYYDPGTGQFTQQDPIGIAGGANVYGFAGGDPVNFSDPFGLCPIPADDCPPGTFTALGTALGAVLGGASGGGAGLLGGPAAPLTVPAGALLGAVNGAAIGGAIGASADALVWMSKGEAREIGRAITEVMGAAFNTAPNRRCVGDYLEECKGNGDTGTKNSRGDFNWRELVGKVREYFNKPEP